MIDICFRFFYYFVSPGVWVGWCTIRPKTRVALALTSELAESALAGLPDDQRFDSLSYLAIGAF
jgi:hypothetical protein